MKGFNKRGTGIHIVLDKHCLILVLLLFSSHISPARDNGDYEEVPVSLTIGGIGSTELPAIVDGDALFLPIDLLFDFLKIRNTTSVTLDSVTGFFITPAAPYIIDKANLVIKFRDTLHDLQQGDLLKTETSLYLRSDYFGRIFHLHTVFNFRSLLVSMSTPLELPAVREAKLAEIRNNITKMKGDPTADIDIPRNHKLFHFGNFDWSVISTQQSSGGAGETRLGLGIGGIVAGGEVNAVLNYSTAYPFRERQQYYQWRYVNNENKLVRQLSLGKIYTQTISSLFAPLVGIQVSNSPSIIRQSFGSYMLNNVTEPGWTVELYVNNVLLDYTKADSMGHYSFKVPLVYGNSIIKLRFYGPYGEERTREENMSIPFNILPAHQFEYTTTAGIIEDGKSSKFSRAALAYGVSQRLTIGGGLEYNSSVATGTSIPFINASTRLSRSLLFSGEYAHGVRSRGVLSYRLPSNWQFDLSYTRYKKEQEAIFTTSALEERKLTVSMPLSMHRFSLFSLVTVNQIILPQSRYTTTEWMLSTIIKRVELRINTYAAYFNRVAPFFYSNISLGYRLPYNIYVLPQLQYDYNHGEFISARGYLEKRIFRTGLISMFYERNFKSSFSNAGIQFRYDLPFAQVNITTRKTNNVYATLESLRGSVIYDHKTKYLATSNKTNVSRGGIVIAPFLDLNCNAIREPGEPKVNGLNIHTRSGQVYRRNSDTTLRIENLEPYSRLYIKQDPSSFDNIAWQIKAPVISIPVTPNVYNYIEVPVSVVAEVAGQVSLITNSTQKGQGQITVCFYKEGVMVAHILSEPDGYFSYVGLAPGNYIVAIDTVQLKKIGMTASAAIPVTIRNNPEGDVVDHLQFLLHRLEMSNTEKENRLNK